MGGLLAELSKFINAVEIVGRLMDVKRFNICMGKR